MRIRTADGQSIPLSELAEFNTERGIISIQHIDGQREIRVTADVSDDKASTSGINADIETIILPEILKKYPSVSVGAEGQARDTAETMASLQKIFPIILICMLFVIILTFGSVSQALIVFMLIPFGFIGVGFGHWFMDVPFSMLSSLGVIALVGILVNDALVFISTFNDKIKAGLPFREALYKSGVSRFRPIVLTTMTTVVGLMPILLEKSVQAQFLIPMAISVAFGLLIATFVLLVLIPALMTLAARIRKTSLSLWTGEKKSAYDAEPSNPNRQHPWPLTLALALGVLILLAILVFGIIKIAAAVV
jgi:multidrug efflux pump subunit AcrB